MRQMVVGFQFNPLTCGLKSAELELLGAKGGKAVRYGLALTFASIVFAVTPCAAADDVTAAARGVVRVIAATKDGDQSSVTFGSGFAISPHHIVTNAHVVSDATNPFADSVVAVVPSEGSQPLRGTIIAYDQARDLAIVDVGETRLEPLSIYTGPVDSGAHAAALGYPGNVDLATANSIYDLIAPTSPVRSEGNVSSARMVDGKSALLHTAAMSHGNSGGPLVDACGRVLGVNTYLTNNDSGDASFGFAVVSQELLSFLREHGEQVTQVGTPCVTLAEQAAREQQARDSAARVQAVADQRAANDQQRQSELAKANAEDSRQNHAMGAGLLALFAVISGAIAATLFIKDRTKAGGVAAAGAAFGLAGAALAFFSRPGLDTSAPVLTASAGAAANAAAAPLSGRLLCRVNLDASRVTVSTTEDLVMSWDSNGCMNGRTQYVQEGSKWRKVLVPNGSETVFVQDFDPAKREYVSTRYLLPQSDMSRLRAIRAGNTLKTCSPSPEAAQQVEQINDQLISGLPPAANEKLVYHCDQQ